VCVCICIHRCDADEAYELESVLAAAPLSYEEEDTCHMRRRIHELKSVIAAAPLPPHSHGVGVSRPRSHPRTHPRTRGGLPPPCCISEIQHGVGVPAGAHENQDDDEEEDEDEDENEDEDEEEEEEEEESENRKRKDDRGGGGGGGGGGREWDELLISQMSESPAIAAAKRNRLVSGYLRDTTRDTTYSLRDTAPTAPLSSTLPSTTRQDSSSTSTAAPSSDTTPLRELTHELGDGEGMFGAGLGGWGGGSLGGGGRGGSARRISFVDLAGEGHPRTHHDECLLITASAAVVVAPAPPAAAAAAPPPEEEEEEEEEGLCKAKAVKEVDADRDRAMEEEGFYTARSIYTSASSLIQSPTAVTALTHRTSTATAPLATAFSTPRGSLGESKRTHSTKNA
jgi:ribosomal protein L12E/L44/L45/RPP1/RPP2